MPARILFVDDEPAIRETLPQILNQHGFAVTAASSVAEGLAAISSATFDLLLSDLNIGQPGDGFTVVSAMRRTQPACITLILTGYPAFETALQAIRSQVDDYLIKPMQPRELVALIERKLAEPALKLPLASASKRVATVIRENIEGVVQRALAAIKAEPELASLPLSDEDRVSRFPALLVELAELLEAPELDRPNWDSLQSAALKGQARRAQGYSIPMVVASLRLLENAIYEVIGENLLGLDLSFVIDDIRRLNNCLILQLEETLRAYLAADRRLMFAASEKWTGWFCDRCCWNRPEPQSEAERVSLATRITAEFQAHACNPADPERARSPEDDNRGEKSQPRNSNQKVS